MKRYLDMIALGGICAIGICTMCLVATLIYVAWIGGNPVFYVLTSDKELRLLSFAFLYFFAILTVGGWIILAIADIVRAITNIILRRNV